MPRTQDKYTNLFFGKLYRQVVNFPLTKKPSEGENEQKNIILFIGMVHPHMIEAIRSWEKQEKKYFRIGLLYDKQQSPLDENDPVLPQLDILLCCDTHSDPDIQKTLEPYTNELFSVTCRAEDMLPMYQRIIPHIPYIKTPTQMSLTWATDKILMRQMLYGYDPEIVPEFAVINELSKKTIDLVEKKVGFPMIIKPAGLAASRLVTICFHKEELEASLKKILSSIASVYKKNGYTGEPRILVEKFMEGSMYSIDGYVDGNGKIDCCPPVFIETGRTIGFDDFFGYKQMTPTIMKKENVDAAEEATRKAVRALGLRSTSFEVELMRLEHGWKIIEVAARMGGFRHKLYAYSYGINHTVNDVLIHAGKKPLVPKSIRGYTIAMKFFAKQEGILTGLTGIKKAQELLSFNTIYIHKKIGDRCRYAKYGGSSVFDIILFNKKRPELLADIRRLEQMIEIETT